MVAREQDLSIQGIHLKQEKVVTTNKIKINKNKNNKKLIL